MNEWWNDEFKVGDARAESATTITDELFKKLGRDNVYMHVMRVHDLTGFALSRPEGTIYYPQTQYLEVSFKHLDRGIQDVLKSVLTGVCLKQVNELKEVFPHATLITTVALGPSYIIEDRYTLMYVMVTHVAEAIE